MTKYGCECTLITTLVLPKVSSVAVNYNEFQLIINGKEIIFEG